MTSTEVMVESTKLLRFDLSSSSSDSESDILEIITPKRKVPSKKRRRSKPVSHQSPQGESVFSLRLNNSLQSILKFLLIAFLIGVVAIETIMLLKLSSRLDRSERLHHVDTDSKRVADTLGEISLRLEQMRTNQTRVQRLVAELAARLEQISTNVTGMSLSTEELNAKVTAAVSNQLPSHVKTANLSFEQIQSKLNTLTDDLNSVRNELSSSIDKSNREIDGTLEGLNSTLISLRDVVAGRETTSELGLSFRSNLEKVVESSRLESEHRIASSLNDTIREMKRELSPPPHEQAERQHPSDSRSSAPSAPDDDHVHSDSKSQPINLEPQIPVDVSAVATTENTSKTPSNLESTEPPTVSHVDIPGNQSGSKSP